ncbi:MAG: TlpA disulfide reductase family protein [Elusimicrobiales bacterium]|nr:TlpA disulfide reductase family protein [Elusimicrobiales bacterium]
MKMNLLVAASAILIVTTPVRAQKTAAAAPAASGKSAASPADRPADKAGAKTGKTIYEKKDTYFSLEKYGGGRVDLADYAGKPVFLMFFSAHCPYCKLAAPFVEKLHETYAKRGLKVAAILTDEASGAAKEFIADYKITFPVALGGRALARTYRAHGVPNFFLLGEDHQVNYQWRGYEEEDLPVITRRVEMTLSESELK